jgi:hypothetical protein
MQAYSRIWHRFRTSWHTSSRVRLPAVHGLLSYYASTYMCTCTEPARLDMLPAISVLAVTTSIIAPQVSQASFCQVPVHAAVLLYHYMACAYAQSW